MPRQRDGIEVGIQGTPVARFLEMTKLDGWCPYVSPSREKTYPLYRKQIERRVKDETK